MNVAQLIRQLKKMRQDREVGYAHHDNSEGEVAGWISYVVESDEICVETGKPTGRNIVVLRG